MVDPKEAEHLANETVINYVSECGCNTPEDMVNVLTKLISMCGMTLCKLVGQKEAVSRLRYITNYINRPEHSEGTVK